MAANTTISLNCFIKSLALHHGSLSKKLKQLHSHFTVEVLTSGFKPIITQKKAISLNQTFYIRSVTIKLNNIPVILATSSTNDSKFIAILRKAQTTPIGLTLFAANSNIKRKPKIKIKTIAIKTTHNPIILTKLLQLNYNGEQKIIYRKSLFTYYKQTMMLEEYFLPTLNQFCSNY